MPRLPDIGLQTWLEDQQRRFYEATAGYFPSLEFDLGTTQTESEIPPDYDAPGGMDQWKEVEQQNIERENRLAQQQEEERLQQETQRLAEQYRQQQAQDEENRRLQEQTRQSSVMEQIRNLGIPTPGDVFSSFSGGPTGDHTSSSGAFSSPGNVQESSALDRFNSFASGLNESLFGASSPPPAPQGASPQPPEEPDHTSTTGIFDQIGSAARSVGEAVANAPSAYRSALDSGIARSQTDPTELEIERGRQRLREIPGRLYEAATPQNIREGLSAAGSAGLEAFDTVARGPVTHQPTWDDPFAHVRDIAQAVRERPIQTAWEGQPLRAYSDIQGAVAGEIGERVGRAAGATDETKIEFTIPESVPILGGQTVRLSEADLARMAGENILDPLNLVGVGEAENLARGAAGAVRRVAPEARGAARAARTAEEGIQYLGSGFVPDAVRPSRRMYHGTGGEFGRPDPGRFDSEGLYGPGYYTTSDPRIAADYAEVRGPVYRVREDNPYKYYSDADLRKIMDDLYDEIADMRPDEDPAVVAHIQEMYRQAEEALDYGPAPETGPNIRAVDVPEDLNLLDMEQPVDMDATLRVFHALEREDHRDVAQRMRREVQTYIADTGGVPYQTGDFLYGDLVHALNDNKLEANRILARAGYDGITHPGGMIRPSLDASGDPIHHQVRIIFPESLDKITNAFSGEAGGSGFVPSSLVGLRGPLSNFAQGAAVGAMGEQTQAQLEGRETDPNRTLTSALGVGAIGVLAGNRAARRAVQSGMRHLGSGFVPEGGSGISQSSIDAIKALKEAGIDDSQIRAIEQDLAAKSRLTLEEVQNLTREPHPEGVSWMTQEWVDRTRKNVEYYQGLYDEELRRVESGESPNRRKLGAQNRVLATHKEALQRAEAQYAKEAEAASALREESMPGGPLTPEEQALNEAADERARTAIPHSGYIEDPTFGVDTPESPSAVRGVEPTPRSPEQPMEAPTGHPYLPSEQRIPPPPREQPMLPGMDEVPRTTQRGPDEPPLRGFGSVPRSTDPDVPGSMTRSEEDLLRAERETMIPGEKPLTDAELIERIAGAIDEDPGVVARKVNEALQLDPADPAVTQGMLRQNTRYQLQRFREANAKWLATKNEIDEILAQNGGRIDAVDPDLAARAVAENAEQLDVLNDLKMGVKGQTLSGKAHSRALNAQKLGYQGAYAVQQAKMMEDVSKGVKAGADAIKEAQAAGGEITGPVRKALREAKAKITGKRAKRALTETEGGPTPSGRGGAGGGGGRRRVGASGTTSPPPRQPKSETLAERLGWLDREYQQIMKSGGNDEDLARNQAEFVEAYRQAQAAARDAARKSNIRRANLPDTDILHRDEEQRIINEALGRRYLSKVKKEAQAQTPDISPQTDRAIMEALSKHYQNQESLLNSIDAQVNRRIDGMVASEQRASVREEVRNMAKAAQINAKAILKDPSSLERGAGQHNEEQFDLMLRKLREHSNTGERVADELEDRFWSQMGRRMTQQEERSYQAGQRAIDEARLNAVAQQIQDVLDNPHGPDRAQRLDELYQDLSEISETGGRRASAIRQSAEEQGILRSGLFAADIDPSYIIEMMHQVDPSDPKSLRMMQEVLARPSLWKQWRELSFINLLSSPVSHAKNIASTGFNMGMWLARQPLEQVFSGGELSGTGAALRGMKEGIRPGARAAEQTLRTGINPERLESAIAAGDYRHIGRELTPGAMGRLWGKVGLGDIGQGLGELWHTVSTRPLEAGDALLGNMARQGALYSGAQRKADRLIREGKLPAEFDLDQTLPQPLREQLADHIVQTIWDHTDVLKEAGKAENYMLFRTNDPDAVEHGLRWFMRLKDFKDDASIERKLLGWAVDFVMPFYQVPYNYSKQGAGNVVGGPVGLIKAGRAALNNDTSAFGQHMAKAVQGSTLMMVPMVLASQDMLTGIGPEDEADRIIWLQDHQPNSVRIPGTNQWMSYEGTPWAIPFSLVAGGYEGAKYGKKPGETDQEAFARGIVGAGKGAIRGALSQSLIDGFAKNFSLLTGQVEGPQDIARGLGAMASRYSPQALLGAPPSGLLNYLADLSDQVERDLGKARRYGTDPEGRWEIGDVALRDIQNRIPGLRQTLPERRDAYGNVVRNPQSIRDAPYIGGILPGYKGQPPTPDDPITRQLEGASVGLPSAPKEITISRHQIPLTINEQRDFQKYYGEIYRIGLERNGAGQKTMNETQLLQIREDARKMAQRMIEQQIGTEELRRRAVLPTPIEVAP